MSSTAAPTVTITPANTTASAAGVTVSAGQTPPASTAPKTTPLYTVYAKYDYDPRSFAVGTYTSYDDAKAGLQAQVINGAQLSIYEMDLIDRTAG